MSVQHEYWQRTGARLGIEVIAPATVDLAGRSVRFAALLPQFGGPNGMLVDPDWSAIEPHVAALEAAGFSFSCVTIGSDADDASLWDMLRDWTWNGKVGLTTDQLAHFQAGDATRGK